MRISIITINYNNLTGLKNTIKSVLDQTFFDFEFIVIDGGSTDGSKAYIQAHSEQFNYWVSEPDKGVYHAMNKGLSKATGEFCLFLNSGDYLFSPSLLEDVVRQIDRSVSMCYGLIKWESSTVLWNPRRDIAYFEMAFQSLIPHQGVFFNTSLLRKIGGYKEEYRVISDWAAMLTLIRKGERTQKIDCIVSICETQGISATYERLAKKERIYYLWRYARITFFLGYLYELKKRFIR
jgi:glycosyltransferase involved in cell wall biosynthesis